MDQLSREALEERVLLLATGKFAEFRKLTRGQSEQQDAQLHQWLAEADMEKLDLLESFERWLPDDQYGACHTLLPALGLSRQADATRLERLLGHVVDRGSAIPHYIGESLSARFSSQPSIAEDLVDRLELQITANQETYQIWANSYATALPKSAARFVIGRLGPPVKNPKATNALVVALPWRLNDVRDEVATHHPQLLAYLANLASSGVDGAWGCIVEFAQFDIDGYRMVAAALSEGVPGAVSSVARSILRVEGVEYGADAVPLVDVLQRIVELAMHDKTICSSVSLALISCLRKADQKTLAYDCLVGLGDGPDDVVLRFNETFQYLADTPALFKSLMTNWLLSPTAKFPAIRDLLGFISAQRTDADLDELLFAKATPLARTKAVRRLLGLHGTGPSLCQFAASIARMETLGEDGLRIAADMFNFLREEYPEATDQFLQPLTAPALRRARGASIFRGIYASSLRWKRHLERLPRRPELRISDADAFSLRSARIKLNNLIRRGGEEMSVLASISSKMNIAQGRRFTAYMEQGPMLISDMATISHSIELPSSELSDPLQGYIRRAKMLEHSR